MAITHFLSYMRRLGAGTTATFPIRFQAKGIHRASFSSLIRKRPVSGRSRQCDLLLGHARVYDDRVVVKQHLLPKPGHEAALYHSFLSEVDIQSLVTYNGKAFDWPQVKTRHTLIRDRVPKLPDFGHFDLLHGSRRLWKHKFDRVSLGTVEKEELGVVRTEDTPGYLAPMMYFHF